jgi:hypothetical protein
VGLPTLHLFMLWPNGVRIIFLKQPVIENVTQGGRAINVMIVFEDGNWPKSFKTRLSFLLSLHRRDVFGFGDQFEWDLPDWIFN